jgi:Mrp family chromosome partitioning ATPase
MSPELRKLATLLDAGGSVGDQAHARATISIPSVAADVPTSMEVTPHRLGDDLDPRLIVLREPASPRAAAFRVLAHRLREQAGARAIAVSSPGRGEGKTTCAVNVALALGEAGRARVLLIETALRTPALADLFGFRPPLCFSRQLAIHRQEPLSPWSVVDVQPLDLHVAAMLVEGDRPAMLDAVAFLIAIERLRPAGYDYIVIDAPAVLGGIDANLVQDAADGTLLCASTRRTRARDVRRAVEQLSPGRILGVALLE